MQAKRKKYVNMRKYLQKGFFPILKSMAEKAAIKPEICSEVNANIMWIYNINMNTNPSIQYIYKSNKADTINNNTYYLQHKMIYSCGNVAIIYDNCSFGQKYYLQHKVMQRNFLINTYYIFLRAKLIL